MTPGEVKFLIKKNNILNDVDIPCFLNILIVCNRKLVKLIKIDCQTLVLCLVLLLLLLQYYDRAKARLRNKITWIIMTTKGPNCHRNASWILSVVILLIIEILTCIKLSVFGVIFDDLYTFWRQYTGHYEMTHRWNNILIKVLAIKLWSHDHLQAHKGCWHMSRPLTLWVKC